MSKTDFDRPLWGAKPIGERLGLTEAQFYYKAARGLLPVTKVGREFVTTEERLRAFLNGEPVARTLKRGEAA